QLQVVTQISALAYTAAAATTTTAAKNIAENITEDIAEISCACAVAATLLVDAGMTVLVIPRSFFRIRQHFKGFVGFFKKLFRFLVVRVSVWVVLHGNTTVGLLEISLRRIAGYAQHFIIVSFRHSPSARAYLSSLTSSNSASTASSAEELAESEASAPAAPAPACCSAYIRCARPEETSVSSLVRASIWARSSVLIAASRAETASSILLFSAASTLSPASDSVLRVAWIRPSAVLRADTSCSNFLSSAALASASLIIRWISSSDRPLEALITMDCCLPVALSFADTFRIPFASRSNATSICGMPRGAGGMSVRSKRPRDLFWLACLRSP